MKSIVLKTSTRLIQPILLMYAIFLLFRGHNEPGGGFVAGLVAVLSFSLYGIAYDITSARDFLFFSPREILGLGLLIALFSGLLPLLTGKPFLTGLWINMEVPMLGKIHLGSPLLFDMGVCFVVVGVTLKMIFCLAEEQV